LEIKDTYTTIAKATDEILFKEKSSKFYGYAFPIESEEEVKPIIEQLRKQHPHAVHYCYAYQIGTEKISYRANDDGEPNNSAGAPIYGQIQSFGLTNVLLVVVRIFGIRRKFWNCNGQNRDQNPKKKCRIHIRHF